MRLIEIAATLLGMSALMLLPVAQANVLEITSPEHLAQTIKANPFLVVEFFAPWCGHCQQLAPEYAAAEEELSDEGIVLASCDMTLEANKPLGDTYDIKGFPTLKMFRAGVMADYNGPRNSAGIVEYLRVQNAPAFTEKSGEDLSEAIANVASTKRPLAVFLVDTDADRNNAQQAAEMLRDSVTVVISGKDDVEEVGATQVPSIAVFAVGSKTANVLSGSLDAEAAFAFVKDATMVQFGQISRDIPDVLKSFVESKRYKLVLLIKAKDDAQFDLVQEIPEALVAKGVRSKFFVGWVDGDTFEAALGHFGTTLDELPIAMVLHDPTDSKYRHSGAWTLNDIVDFAARVPNGEEKPYVRSQAVVDNSKNAVWTVVRDNLDTIVNGDTNVFLKVYAPWCSHCKAMVPALEQLGEALRDEPRVVIGKIDATANDLPANYGVKGFPTLLWFPKGGGAPLVFDGARDFAGMMAYVRQQANLDDLVVRTVDVPAAAETTKPRSSHPPTVVDHLLSALNQTYALGLSGWVFVGGALVLAFVAIFLLLGALHDAPTPAGPAKSGSSKPPAAAAAAAASSSSAKKTRSNKDD